MMSIQTDATKHRQITYPYHEETVTETTWHYRAAQYLHNVLELRYHDSPDVFVGANNFIYWEEGNVDEKESPDVYVCFGARNIDRPSYKTWEEGGLAPQVVFEISSKSTRINDLGTKKATNEMLGVEEYYVFDPLKEYIPWGLRAYRLDQEGFTELPETAAQFRPKGKKRASAPDRPAIRIHSPRLGLDLGVDGPLLRLYLPSSILALPTYAESERARREAEQARREAEQARREAEERIALLERENQELRRRLSGD